MQGDQAETVVANFIQKAFQILQAKKYESTIHWMNNGREFIIVDIAQFQQQILPVFFRHRNINSFIRQLNMYGFHKSRKDPSKNIFAHPSFLRGQPQLLQHVRRKVKLEKTLPKPSIKHSNDFRNNQNKSPAAQFSSNKDSQYPEPIFLKVQKQLPPTKTQIAASHGSLSYLSLKSFGLSTEVSPFKDLMEKSQIMDSNPEVYLKMHENSMEPNFDGESDRDNASIADEIEQERRILEGRRIGVALMRTYNILNDLN